MRVRPPVVPYVDVEAFRRAFAGAAVALERFGREMKPVIVSLASEMDSLRYRMLVTNLMRTRTFEEATALAGLRRARDIPNGRRRHGMVKHRRDELRAARRKANRSYPN